MMTQFKTIKDFPNYLIRLNPEGEADIISLERKQKTKGSKLNKSKILKQTIGTYKEIGLYNSKFTKSGRLHHVHRLMAIAFIPNPDNLPEVDHIDRNKLNNNISNLRWVTKSDQLLNAHKDPNRKKTSLKNRKRDSLGRVI